MPTRSSGNSGTRLLHISDTHLGYVAYGDARRAQDFEDAFVEAIEIAIDRGVDGVVHTGDLTHSDDASAVLSRRVYRVLERLSAAEIPFYFILGNHDIDATGQPQNWADEIVSEDLGKRLGRQPTLCGNISLYGLDYHDEEWWVEPNLTFDDPVPKTRSVLCLHQSVGPIVEDDYSETTVATIRDHSTVNIDLALLGHSHYTATHENDGLPAHYAGATERTTRGYRDETISVSELTITDDTVTYEFHELDSRPFTTFTADYPASVEPSQVRDDLADFDVTGEVVTIYRSDRTNPDLIQQAFVNAGAFDTRVWPWHGNRVPHGLTSQPAAGSPTTPTDDAGDTTDSATVSDTDTSISTTGSLVHVGSVEFGRDPDVPGAVPVDRAFGEIVETAINRSVDAVIVMGPLFVPNPPPAVVDQCRAHLERAADADIPVLLAPSAESQSSDAIATLRNEDLLEILSLEGVTTDALSIHGISPGSDFATDLLQLAPSTETRHGVVVSQESVAPPTPGSDAAWNYTQVRDLIDAGVDALFLGNGTGAYVQDDRLLVEGTDLVAPLDESCFETDAYPGQFSLVTVDDTDESPRIEISEISAPPLVRHEMTVDDSTTYEDIWTDFETSDVKDAHVRIQLRGADTTIRTRLARELQQEATSVVVWDGEDDVITEDILTAPGTDHPVVAEREPDEDTPRITPDFELESPEGVRRPVSGSALVEAGHATVTARDDDRCGFVLDVRAWEADTDMRSTVDYTSLLRGKWYCPHAVHADHETCIFHTRSQKVDKAEERRQFLNALESASTKRELQFYGASLSSLVFSGQELDAVQHYPVDLQHTTLGHVRLEDARVQQPLQLNNATLEEGLLVKNTKVDADLSLHGAHVVDDLRVQFSEFAVRPMFSHVFFDGALAFQQSDFANGLTTSNSHVTGHLKFRNCTIGGHTTFYDAVFHESVVINRTNFQLECRFDGARVADDIRLFETTFDQRFDLRETTTGGTLQIRQSGFGGKVDLSNTTTRAVVVEDSSFANTINVQQSQFDRFVFEHVSVDGTLRIGLSEFGTLRLETVTCLDHVELVGDSLSDPATVDTVHGDFTVTNGIFHRPLEIRTAGIGGECRLDESVFHDAVSLTDTVIGGRCSLARTTLEGELLLDGALDEGITLDDAVFESRVVADGISTIDGPVRARRTLFGSNLDLSDTVFIDQLDLSGAECHGVAVFDEVVCHGTASFEGTMFGGLARFESATVKSPLVFKDAVFEGDAVFVELTVVDADASFENTRFHSTLALTGAEFDGSVALDNTRVDDRATVVGMVVGGPLTLTDARFTDAVQFDHTNLDDGLVATGATFEKGATFDDLTVDTCFEADGATFDRPATFVGITTTADCRAAFSRTKFTSDVSFHNAAFGGCLDFDQSTVTGALDFTDVTVVGPCTFTRTTFAEPAYFSESVFQDGLTFDEVAANRTVDFVNTTFDESSATFDLARFHGPATFRGLTSTATLSFEDVSFHDRTTFDAATLAADVSFHVAAFEGAASFVDCHFQEMASFRNATFDDAARFTNTTFDKGASFQEAHIETPCLDETRSGTGELDCTGATLGSGHLVQPSDVSPTLYDFRNAVLGDLRIRRNDSPVDFDAFRFIGTRYDGFQFAKHPGIRGKDTPLEAYAGTESPTTAELETTYLNAKNGATQVGDSDAAGDFFVQELTHRGTTHRESGCWVDYLKNRGLRSIAMYGQSPARVVLTGLRTIYVFGLIYYVAQLFSTTFPAHPESPYQGLSGSFLLSFEAFTTLVFSGANVTNPGIRFVGALEGFIGAFTIALFLYALTQSIDR